jgi:hypothetical protein
MEETRENIVAILKHALSDPLRKFTQKRICKEAGLGIKDPQFSKLLNARDGKEFGPDHVKALWIYAYQHLRFAIEWIEAHPVSQKQDHHLQKKINSLGDFHHSLTKFYAAHPEQMTEYRSLGIQSYYYSFKYSYRWHHQILKAVAVILTARIRHKPVLIFVERQVSTDRRQREDTVGIVYSKTKTLWIEGQEILTEQPRKFSMPIRDIRRSGSSGDELIQSLCGFCVETYAKFPNNYGGRHGGFGSPIALQRIPERRLRRVTLHGDPFKVDNIDTVLTMLTEGCGYITRRRFARDKTIAPPVKSHMKFYDWSDSHRKQPRVK